MQHGNRHTNLGAQPTPEVVSAVVGFSSTPPGSKKVKILYPVWQLIQAPLIGLFYSNPCDYDVGKKEKRRKRPHMYIVSTVPTAGNEWHSSVIARCNLPLVTLG